MLDQLNESGYKTLIAENGEVGIKRAIYAQPDLILLDIMMPGIDGFETCRQLKNNPKTCNIPIIFITALTSLPNRVQGFESGAVDYVTKPFQKEEVIARIHTHLTIQDQKKELEKLNRTKDTFFSILAHDLRGAFVPLVGSVDIIERMLLNHNDEKLQKVISRIVGSVRNINKLLENLLCWGRLQRKQLTIDPQSIDLFKLMEWLIQLYKEQARQKNISLRHSIDSDLIVWADANMTETIFRNLITNAIKFTRAGEVSIDATIESDEIVIAIKDSGVGIASDRLPGIFKPDVKSKTKGTAGEVGTGLGLILCEEFARMNGGKIHVESEIDKGTTFYVHLPHPG
ncbi:MAG: response regulator receiver sensor signal transduction histidine kinase [Candidatus Magnetoglobus multicellularis str. Araruama]|uniref:histidine kinase n=1 Tax=Candidatus Magnetoglobus multicellularis str. Araruama TaxID=890399 RepID=A0A1V1NXD8_9BACT|nr:MAG: response regulator receiver sensor signal transduction histidine kinase [Candidatus Magnetoglobus multicellularis str. Araruama]